MAYIAPDPSRYDGKLVGSGQCVAFVQEAAGVGPTTSWRPGRHVKKAGPTDIAPGTAIATFIDGKYASKPTGNHAAIYISHDKQGIWVWDQWSGKRVQPVHQRRISYKPGNADPSNDGDFFYVIE